MDFRLFVPSLGFAALFFTVTGFGTTVLAATPAQTWTVTEAAGGCQLRSAEQALNDGYLDTQAQLIFTGDKLRATTGSVIDLATDLGVDDLGVAVDDGSLIHIAAIEDETNVLLTDTSDTFVDQFIRGGNAQLRLRFWPSWPSLGTRTANFSLKGFTRAWKEFEQCR